MNNKTLMKILSICFLVVMAFNFTGNIYAAVNTSYASDANQVVEVDLEAKLQNSTILDVIAQLVYALGSLVESLVGSVFYKLTGTNMFPWADRVIFNTVPFLDINFLNPSASSLFQSETGGDTILAGLVRNTYYTVLILAIGFLGIIVGVMAVRLAISTIAAEKAKYKEAIVKFLVSLVMLFCIHYGISFIFYLNESLVEIASSILTKNLEGVEITENFFQTQLTDEDLVKNFFKKNNDDGKEILENEESTKIAARLLRDANYRKYVIPEAYGNSVTENKWYHKIDNYLPWNWGDDADAVKKLKTDVARVKDGNEMTTVIIPTYEAYLDCKRDGEKFIKTQYGKPLYEKYMEIERKKIVTKDDNNDYNTGGNNENDTGTASKPGDNGYTGGPGGTTKSGSRKKSSGEEKWETTGKKNAHNAYVKHVLPETMVTYKSYIDAYNIESMKVSTQDFISQMGQFFKDSAWTYETDEQGHIEGWSATELSLQGALLYSIFVIQSMLYFVAYIKRFFFVVILALLAPIIVLYDFLGKAIM